MTKRQRKNPAPRPEQTETREEPPSGEQPVAEKYKAEIERARPFLQRGWHVAQSGVRLTIRQTEPPRGKTDIAPWNDGLATYLMDRETSGVKEWREKKEKLEKTGELAPAPATRMELSRYISEKAVREVPIVRNLLGKMSWFQNSIYDIGVLTFFKILQTPGLMDEKAWRITVSDTSPEVDQQQAREVFINNFEHALNRLIRTKDAAGELARLDYTLSLAEGRFLKMKVDWKEQKLRGDYYEQAFKIAQSCMCTNDLREMLSRLIVTGFITATTQAQESLDTEIAKKEGGKE